MRKLLIVALALTMVVGYAAASRADTASSASCHVRVLVDPNVAIEPLNSDVDAGSIQYGDFSATCGFRVDANKQEVTFYAEASPLFKADDPTGTEVPPIPLNLSEGILLTPQNGNATGGEDNVLDYVGIVGDGSCEGYPTILTEEKEFSSSQSGHFSQNVTLVVVWNQNDHEKPTGEYSGVVKLTALLMPDEYPL